MNNILPLHADIRKYPHSVTALKSRWTTGLVWPLHVNGVCLKFAIFAILGHVFVRQQITRVRIANCFYVAA